MSRNRQLLKSLRHDRQGNVLPMAAAGVLVMAALIGGAVDMSRSCPTGWCKSRRSKVGSGSGQAATAGRLTMGLWLTEPRVSSVM